MRFKHPFWRFLTAFAVVSCVAVLLFLIFNAGGWRARLIARLTRVDNDPVIVAPPPGFQPQVPSGFNVSVFANGFRSPRWLAIAPDGDVFVADSGAGEVICLHIAQDGTFESRTIFAEHLKLPFGIAFHAGYVYVADTNEVLRFPYDPQTSQRLGSAEHIIDLPGMGYNQHWTRSLAFSADGTKLFVSVGSKTNVGIEADPRRAAIWVMAPDGSNPQLYASGLRNAVGIACNPDSGDLWASVNERDDIGDDTPLDFFTDVHQDGFYGWPYAYGNHQKDNRVSPRPDLVARMILPDVWLGPHVAPLQFAFYDKQQFPSEYWHGAFVAEHGSWNRRIRSGYQVVFVPFHKGMPAGKPKPFLTGFVPNAAAKEVYGRMVGVAVATDGSLLISDDGSRQIWRVSYAAKLSN